MTVTKRQALCLDLFFHLNELGVGSYPTDGTNKVLQRWSHGRDCVLY
jgi:hypothetical protein